MVGDKGCEPGCLVWIPAPQTPITHCGVGCPVSLSVLWEVEVVTWNPFEILWTRLNESHLAAIRPQ